MISLLETVPWAAVISVVAAGGLFGLGGYLFRHRGKPGANWFIGTLLVQGTWSLTYGISLLVSDVGLHVAIELGSFLALAWLGYLFLGFALEYTGHSAIRRSWLFPALALVPAAMTVLLLTAPFHSLLWGDIRLVQVLGVVTLEYDFRSWAFVGVLLNLVYAGVGVFLLVDTIYSYGQLYRSEAFAVGLSTVPVAVGVLLWIFDLGDWTALNWGVILSVVHVALDTYAFVGINMFETSPATRRIADKAAIDTLPNPAFVLDENNRLVDYNDAGATAFGLDPSSLGGPVSTAVHPHVLPTNRTSTQYVTVTVDDRLIEYNVRSSSLSDSRGDLVGYTVLLQDVTDERERRQRLEVLNRVLRHNLRNKITAVMGHADEIETATNDEPVGRLADQIVCTSESLVAIAEKARTFDRLRQLEPTFEEVDVSTVLADVSRAFGDRDGATLETTIDAETTLITDPALLRFALENVVENAIEHGGESPHVRVSVIESSTEDNAVELAVQDDGPGIPPTEVAVIEQGREQDLSHGAGIGLWIVKWSFDSLRGTVAFERPEQGTTVRLTLPRDPRSERIDRPHAPD